MTKSKYVYCGDYVFFDIYLFFGAKNAGDQKMFSYAKTNAGRYVPFKLSIFPR